MIGLAAVFIAIAAVVEPQSLGIVEHMGYAIPVGNRRAVPRCGHRRHHLPVR